MDGLSMEVMNMIYLVLINIYWNMCMMWREMGLGISDHSVILRVKLVGTWIKRSEVNGAGRIKSEVLRTTVQGGIC